MTSRVDPQLALALLVKEKWKSSGHDLPAAIDTVMWGDNAASPKEVMIQTGHFDEPEKIIPQLIFNNMPGYGNPVHDGEERVTYVRILCSVPRTYDDQNPSTLKDYAYQLMIECLRICNTYKGTVLNDTSNADYWISRSIGDAPINLWPAWHSHELMVPLHYMS